MNVRNATRKTSQRIVQRLAVAAVALCSLAPTAALAQAEARLPEEKKPIKAWLFVAVATGLFIAIAIKNPKRSHQG